MEFFKTWMVGLDMTDTDRSIVKNVAALATKFEPEEIYFLHVAPDLDLPKDVIDDIPDLHFPILADFEQKIKTLIEEFFDRSDTVKIQVKQGNAVTEMLKVANKIEVDVMILGHKAITHGTVHKKILRKAPCSVMFIPESFNGSINSVVIPTDFSEYSTMSANLGITISNTYNASEVHFLHIYQDASKYLSQVFETLHEIDGILAKRKAVDEKLQLYAEHKLQNYIKGFFDYNAEIQPHIQSIDRGEDVGSAVEKWVNRHEPDLVIMGSKGEHSAAATLLGSVSEHLNEKDTRHLMIVVKRTGENRSLLKVLLGV